MAPLASIHRLIVNSSCFWNSSSAVVWLGLHARVPIVMVPGPVLSAADIASLPTRPVSWSGRSVAIWPFARIRFTTLGVRSFHLGSRVLVGVRVLGH